MKTELDFNFTKTKEVTELGIKLKVNWRMPGKLVEKLLIGLGEMLLGAVIEYLLKEDVQGFVQAAIQGLINNM
ncbi:MULTISPECIES: hypothetical protein [Bacillati]|uniref:Uncharacterized protein n=1 Tax=Niallia taxi TaxID=2499688 RepID=A0A437K7C0_9BACI|nr:MULTISPECIES: hypothetical protein [Niallia]MDK8642467.1 hypothetical protein [Niallia taxi]MED4040555.1 hypothetical protein [Niallia taxi]MED4056995.1 hypothetical protein [Niallia taxi]MED4121659.1 hypothetical protein [Niallia taxi]RVT59511.1 hypothetical protein EM808_19650 [Niallia taxi]